jgi:hypothetical protein
LMSSLSLKKISLQHVILPFVSRVGKRIESSKSIPIFQGDVYFWRSFSVPTFTIICNPHIVIHI